ncbi:transcriptional regulator, LacI family [Tranquillimonas rosea]|uniref:Transcriptional regulator, LacI family n=1 Tax=Tranquillimonas rosea TaxID=641238 RepID=A0A1H9RE45_9RHOB|nr:LacI family DNA-binding transcriptional regulator [Tranquillimonas rosea]SER70972.1 transcriptional regulator, LacI family [Tranquillimonas rosea]
MCPTGNKKTPTLADVAEAANVSAVTVSRFFRHPEKVSEAARGRIEQAVSELGYAPNAAASALASRRTNIIGLLVPSLTNNVFNDVLSGAFDEVQGTPYSIQIGNYRYRPSEEEALIRTFLHQKPLGLVIAGGNQTPAAAEMLRAADCRIVQIMDTEIDGIDMVLGLSHTEAAEAAVRHLRERGYQRIGFLGARMDPRSQNRLAGYHRAVADLDDPTDSRVFTTPEASSTELGGRLLSDLLAAMPDTDAVFCNNDDLAAGALFECQRRGMRVPDRLAICGFNDLEMMAQTCPPISSVRIFRHEMGRRSVRLMIEAVAGAGVERGLREDLGFEIVERASTRPR